MHAVPEAMAAAAEKAEVAFRYGTAVDRILLAEGTTGRVKGIRLESGETIEADRFLTRDPKRRCNSSYDVNKSPRK